MRACTALIAILLSGPVAADELMTSITDRLSLMKPVAAWKQARGVPVEDRAREEVVLAKAAENAEAEGIDPATVRPFFAAQIEAAKDIQRCWIAEWAQGAAAPPEDVPDLKADIRPKLLSLGQQILGGIKTDLAAGESLSERGGPAAPIACLDDAYWQAIRDALGQVRLKDTG
ncbi:MAG: gamma subclass chorismate mutase AroQ [Pseudomonadota bacterium]